MMRLDTDPMTPALRTRGTQADPLPLLIQVPRAHGPSRRVGGRTTEATEFGRITRRPSARARRRLRPGVRRAGWTLLVLGAMAGTIAVGWTTDVRSPRLPLMQAAGSVSEPVAPEPIIRAARWSEPPDAIAEADGDGGPIGPILGAPVADAEVPVVFPGYLLPDNSRGEPAHEGS